MSGFRKLSSSLVQMIKKISVSPIQPPVAIMEELKEIKQKEAEAKAQVPLPSNISKIVLVITIPYLFIFPLFAKNLHDWYFTSLMCLLVCYTVDLLFIAFKFFDFLRIISSFEAASITAMLLFYSKYVFLKYPSPWSYSVFSLFFVLVVPSYYRCWLLLKLKPAHKKMFKAVVEDDFYDRCSLDPNDYQMVVTYGRPLKYSTPSVLSVAFDECVQKCWSNSTCVLVYDTSPTCQMFVLANITSVQKLNSSSNSRIAFRIYSTYKTCPNLTTTPILVGGTVTGNTYYNIQNVLQVYQKFNLTLNTKTNIWSFTSTVFYPCYATVPMVRGGIVYCITLNPTSNCINKSEALNQLSPLNGYNLMSFANMGEYQYFKKNAIGSISQQTGSRNYTRLGFWIDGVRKPSCTSPAVRSASCNGTNEFNYSDTTAPNPVFEWVPGQPDGILNDSPNSDCLYLRASNDGDSGVDDIPCNYTIDASMDLCLTGYLIGTYAVPNSVK